MILRKTVGVEALQGSWHGRHAGDNKEVHLQLIFFVGCLLHVTRGLCRHLCNIFKLSLQVTEIKNRFLRSEVMALRDISVSTIDSFQVRIWWGAIILKLYMPYGLFFIWRQASLAYQHKPVLHNWLKNSSLEKHRDLLWRVCRWMSQ